MVLFLLHRVWLFGDKKTAPKTMNALRRTKSEIVRGTTQIARAGSPPDERRSGSFKP